MRSRSPKNHSSALDPNAGLILCLSCNKAGNQTGLQKALPVSFAFALMLAMTLLLGWQSLGYAATDDAIDTPDVVELFTSHGCSSCPSADKLLAELIEKNPQLVALEFHVDYWNQLVHGGDGNWVDPFSDAAYTERQRQYNQTALAGRLGVYTPQLIINGEYAAVGSDRNKILPQLGQRDAPISIKASQTESGDLQLDLQNPDEHNSTLWLVTFDVAIKTEITAGENTNLVIDNHHIVKSLVPLQKIDSATSMVNVPLNLAQNEGCAVLVQSEPLQPILGAALCPR